ncbi:hypothetical protein Tco_0466202, partial [Tanacetum coccineum]
MKHVGVASWFSQLRTAQSDFVSRERIVWIDIPGFTLADQVKSDRKNSPLHSHSGDLNSRVLEESQPTKDQGSPKDNLNQRVGGSILEVIDDMIKVGQAMGFTMEGSKEFAMVSNELFIPKCSRPRIQGQKGLDQGVKQQTQ